VVKSKLALGLALISGCATLPEGPSITALPGTGKSLEEFRAADDACRQDSLERVRGVTPNLGVTETDQKRAAETAVNPAAGASIGAGEDASTDSGMAGAIPADTQTVSARDLRYRYDSAYIKCMYAKGHRVPVSGRVITPSSAHAPFSSGSAYPPSDAYPATPPRDSWYAPPPDFSPEPPSHP
jgi:hypothetical protein